MNKKPYGCNRNGLETLKMAGFYVSVAGVVLILTFSQRKSYNPNLNGVYTCRGYSGKHPALSEFDRLSSLEVLVEDFDGAGPGSWSDARRVLAGPVAHQHSGVVVRVDLHANRNISKVISHQHTPYPDREKQ